MATPRLESKYALATGGSRGIEFASRVSLDDLK